MTTLSTKKNTSLDLTFTNFHLSGLNYFNLIKTDSSLLGVCRETQEAKPELPEQKTEERYSAKIVRTYIPAPGTRNPEGGYSPDIPALRRKFSVTSRMEARETMQK